MDFIVDEEIEKVYVAEKEEVEARIAAAKGAGEYGLKVQTYADQHKLYFTLPNKLVIVLIKWYYCQDSNEHKEVAEFQKLNEPFSKLSAIKCIGLPVLDAAFDGLQWPFLIKRLEKGWNTGCSANSFKSLNRLAASRAQLEFIPFFDTKRGLFAHKVRYNAVPYLPYQGSYFGVNFSYRIGPTGLEPRVVPDNLSEALVTAKTVWKPKALAELFLKHAHAYLPGRIKNHLNMALVLGGNIDRLNKAYKDLDPSVALFIKPHRKEQSIFAGVYLPAWAAFFEGFAEDGCGPVSAARMLASLSYDSFYGKLDDIAVWSATPKVLKTLNKLESVVKHVYVDFYSLNDWPKKALVYNPTPAELNAYIYAMGPPVALAMPLTAVISSAPQVNVFCSLFAKVTVEVYFCTTPMVIFKPSTTGLDGRGMKDYLPSMELAIVKGFLEVIKLKIDEPAYTGFSLTPGKEHAANKLSISVKPIKKAASCTSTRFMQMTDAELSRYVPTARITDITIDGVSVKRNKGTLVPQYPRGMPKRIKLNLPIEVGACYNNSLEKIKTTLKIDPATWTLRDPVSGVVVEADTNHVDLAAIAKKKEEKAAKKQKAAEEKAAADAKAAAEKREADAKKRAEELKRREEAAAAREAPKPASPVEVPYTGPTSPSGVTYVPLDMDKTIAATLEEFREAEAEMVL